MLNTGLDEAQPESRLPGETAIGKLVKAMECKEIQPVNPKGNQP